MAIVPDLSGNNPGNPDINGWDGTDDHIPSTNELEQEYYASGGSSEFMAGIMQLETALEVREELGTHDAANITTGTIDVARIPALASGVQIVSPGAIADLTAPQQANVVIGAVVTTTDGRRWVYSGSGSKTLEASYIELADVTPDWSVIANKPTIVAVGATVGSADTNAQTGTAGSSADAARADHTHPFPSATINSQTGTTYTIVASDHGKIIECSNASAITVTMPNLFTGFNCGIYQAGAGQITVVGSSMTLRNRSTHTKSAGIYAELGIRQRSATEFVLSGDTAA